MVQLRDVWAEEIEAALAGKKTAKQALDEAVSRGNAMLRQFERQSVTLSDRVRRSCACPRNAGEARRVSAYTIAIGRPGEPVAALDAQRQHHVDELLDVLGRQARQVQVLVDVDAVLGEKFLMHRERLVGIGIRHDLDGPAVRADNAHLLVDAPLGGRSCRCRARP